MRRRAGQPARIPVVSNVNRKDRSHIVRAGPPSMTLRRRRFADRDERRRRRQGRGRPASSRSNPDRTGLRAGAVGRGRSRRRIPAAAGADRGGPPPDCRGAWRGRPAGASHRQPRAGRRTATRSAFAARRSRKAGPTWANCWPSWKSRWRHAWTASEPTTSPASRAASPPPTGTAPTWSASGFRRSRRTASSGADTRSFRRPRSSPNTLPPSSGVTPGNCSRGRKSRGWSRTSACGARRWWPRSPHDSRSPPCRRSSRACCASKPRSTTSRPSSRP